MARGSLHPILALSVALLLAPLALAQFSTDDTPACCRTCFDSTLTQYAGEGSGSLGAWCKDDTFMGALKSCWDKACTEPADATKGQQQWRAACSYAASTAAIADEVQSSFAAKVATEPGIAVMPPVTSTVTASPSLSAPSTAAAIAQSDVARLASTSTSGAIKLACTSLAAVIGAVILAVVVFLEAGPSL